MMSINGNAAGDAFGMTMNNDGIVLGHNIATYTP